jgi:ribonuclease HI
MKVSVFCDASFDRKSRAGGVGVYFQSRNEDASVSMPVTGMLDCNHGELFALFVVLVSLERNADDLKSLHVTVYVDSDFVFELVNSKREPSPERFNENMLVSNIKSNMQKFKAVELVCLKSHQGKSPLGMANEHADRLAKKAMRNLRDNKVTSVNLNDTEALAKQLFTTTTYAEAS